MTTKIKFLVAGVFVVSANAQAQSAPYVSQVLIYSATIPNLTVPINSGGSFTLHQAVPSIFSQTGTVANLTGDPNVGAIIFNGANYTVNRNFVQVSSALNASIATALSIIPLSSPASGVIERKDPATGAELAESSTLGPIFTERAETIGKRHFYIGFSNQDFHFTRYNGASLNALSVLYTGGDPSKVVLSAGASTLQTLPASFNLGLDVRLSQNIAFLTYGVTDRFDISLGLPVVHAAVAARTYNGTIYAGNGFNPALGGTCWCVDTFTPGYPTLIQPQVGQASYAKSGFGDLLVRAKGTVLRKPWMVVGVGADVRFPTGDERNYLGVGSTSVKPFAAVSFYSKPLRNGIVLSPHFDVGWQFTGKSILGGQLQGTSASQSTPLGTISYIGAPFTSTKDYVPDVFSWAVGAEVAFGHRNTFIADVLGNQIGWIHGFPSTTNLALSNLAFPTGPNGDFSGNAVPTKGSVSGLVGAGSVSFGQYSGSFGYKAKVLGNLVANVNALVRFDNNGLTARFVPLFGLGYSF
jgi:hypothetical protein